jgi:hypothetical protein
MYVIWYRLYNFLLCRRDVDIIDLNYKKGMGMFLFKNQIIFGNYSKTPLLVRYVTFLLQKYAKGLVLEKILLFRWNKCKTNQERQQ